VFATEISALAGHIKSCERHGVPTLAFFEDAESALSENDSDVKNFLSGIDAKQNKGGTCIVYTTNYPNLIEDTIKERPERIDELHHIGPISGDILVECAKYYFGANLPETVDLHAVLSEPMTGAEVKLMVENVLRYCASRMLPIDEKAIENVLRKYSSDIEQLRKFTESAKKTYAKSHKNGGGMGFSQGTAWSVQDVESWG
jgi:AAA+ superfamily predicted ATPase